VHRVYGEGQLHPSMCLTYRPNLFCTQGDCLKWSQARSRSLPACLGHTGLSISTPQLALPPYYLSPSPTTFLLPHPFVRHGHAVRSSTRVA